MLVFAPLSGHFATLLRDTVRTLLPEHDVYITDWIDAKEIPISVGPFHFDDYVAYVRELIAFVGGSDVHAISVCQPTVPVLAGVSLAIGNWLDALFPVLHSFVFFYAIRVFIGFRNSWEDLRRGSA